MMASLDHIDITVAVNRARPAREYHEDMGPVLWWTFPINEPPYVGTPNDLGSLVIVEMQGARAVDRNRSLPSMRGFVGGWPGYHTHFTPIISPQEPT